MKPMAATIDTACRTNDSWICHATWNATHNSDAAHAADVISVGTTILLIVVGSWLAQRLIWRFLKHTMRGLRTDRVQRGLSSIRRRTPRALLDTGAHMSMRRAQRAETMTSILRNITTIVVVMVAAFLILNQLTVDLAPFVAGTAIATAALGFGAQNIVRDFLAGFFIVVEDQYGVGDVIDVNEVSGTVEGVSLRVTRVRSADGTLWHIPNGELKRVGNKSQAWSRALITFVVDAGSPLELTRRTIQEAAEKLREDPKFQTSMLDHPEVWGPENISGKGIEFKLAVKTPPFEQWRLSRALRVAVKDGMDQQGIRLAEYVEGTPVVDNTPPAGDS
jgi:moderate conductance mechanosensitive channel